MMSLEPISKHCRLLKMTRIEDTKNIYSMTQILRELYDYKMTVLLHIGQLISISH